MYNTEKVVNKNKYSLSLEFHLALLVRFNSLGWMKGCQLQSIPHPLQDLQIFLSSYLKLIEWNAQLEFTSLLYGTERWTTN